MERLKLNWCREVMEQIRFKPDRDKIWDELMAHIEDRSETLMESGLTEEEAETKAVAAMGNPEEVGKQLDAVHKPWLGWLWIVSKVLVIFLLIAALTLVPDMIKNYKIELNGALEGEWKGFREENMPQNTYCTDLYDLNLTAEVDGYQFIVDRVAWWSTDSGDAVQLYIQMDIKRPIFRPALDRNVLERFYIKDDQGLCMGVDEVDPVDYDPVIGLYSRGVSYDDRRAKNPFLGECLFTFSAFVWDPEWVDVCYEYEGRSMTFRIPGPGGGST